MQQAVSYTPTMETLNTMVPGSAPRQVQMFNPIRDCNGAVDALMLRRYKPPTQPRTQRRVDGPRRPQAQSVGHQRAGSG